MSKLAELQQSHTCSNCKRKNLAQNQIGKDNCMYCVNDIDTPALPKCHVCKGIKHPYEVWLKSDIVSIIAHEKQHEEARKDGEICKRCNSYHTRTGKLEVPPKEFKI